MAVKVEAITFTESEIRDLSKISDRPAFFAGQKVSQLPSEVQFGPWRKPGLTEVVHNNHISEIDGEAHVPVCLYGPAPKETEKLPKQGTLILLFEAPLQEHVLNDVAIGG